MDDFQEDDFAEDEAPKDKRSKMLQAWHALQKPSEMSRSGLSQITTGDPEAVNNFLALGGPAIGLGQTNAYRAIKAFRDLPKETGNLPYDLVRGAPKIAIETAGQVAPSFINRASMVTAGLSRVARGLAPLAKGAIRAAGAQAEEISGIAPKHAGALEAAYKDPSILRASKGQAGQYYEAAKDELNAAKDSYRATGTTPQGDVSMDKVKDIFEGMFEPKDILDKANQFVRGGGKLEPAEALKVRKAIDSLLKSKRYVPDELLKMRDQYDEIAKLSENLAKGDETYQRGRFGDVLSKWAPQNVHGGASTFKLGIAAGLRGLGVPEPVVAVLLSPRLQGLAAASAGVGERQVLSPLVNSAANSIGAKEIPGSIKAIAEALSRRKQEKSRGQ